MKQIILSSAIILSFIFTVSCSTAPVCVTSSVTPLQGKTITENLGKTKGSDSAFSILALYMIGRPDLDAALKEAIQAKGGDTLINVRCYETWSWFILFSITTVKVEGDAVKLGAAEPAVKGKKK
jgi:hypothetical protein